MPELKKYKPPLRVEARRQEREDAMAASDLSASDGPLHLTTSSTSSAEIPSPTTPTFSARGHSRFPSSSNSSLASSPIVRESMDGFPTQKRPLTEVMEEPHERESDYEIITTKEVIGGERGESKCSQSAIDKQRPGFNGG